MNLHMRWAAIVLTASLLFATVASGSIVDLSIAHGTAVAFSAQNNGNAKLLLANGDVWIVGGVIDGQPTWLRDPTLTLPVPIDSVAFWEGEYFVDKSSSVWRYAQYRWFIYGPPPGVTAINPDALPRAKLGIQAFPNPARGVTTIRYTVDKRSQTVVSVFDVRGKLVVKLTDAEHDAGPHEQLFIAPAPGVYFLQIISGEDIATRKIVLTE